MLSHHPSLRRANRDDFGVLHAIWMQDHINPFMSLVSTVLETCKKAIQQEFDAKHIDSYAKLYLENLAFQMTREGLGETRLYIQDNLPWLHLIEQLPEKLQTTFISLARVTKVIELKKYKKDEIEAVNYNPDQKQRF